MSVISTFWKEDTKQILAPISFLASYSTIIHMMGYLLKLRSKIHVSQTEISLTKIIYCGQMEAAWFIFPAVILYQIGPALFRPSKRVGLKWSQSRCWKQFGGCCSSQSERWCALGPDCCKAIEKLMEWRNI